MPDFFQKLTGTIDRRSPPNEGDMSEPLLRENWLCRDGVLQRPPGTERAITNLFDDIPRWTGRYYSLEAGVTQPKTFVYTEDGKLWIINELAQTATSISPMSCSEVISPLLFHIVILCLRRL